MYLVYRIACCSIRNEKMKKIFLTHIPLSHTLFAFNRCETFCWSGFIKNESLKIRINNETDTSPQMFLWLLRQITWHHQVKGKGMNFTTKQMVVVFFSYIVVVVVVITVVLYIKTTISFTLIDSFTFAFHSNVNFFLLQCFYFFSSLFMAVLLVLHRMCERAARDEKLVYYCMWCMKFGVGIYF